MDQEHPISEPSKGKYEDLEVNIRKTVINHPQMFLGSHQLDNDGLHFIVTDIVESAADSITLNEATHVSIILTKAGEIVIDDDGRGLPYSFQGNVKSSYAPIELVLMGYAINHATEAYYRERGFLSHIGTVMGMLSESLIIETCWENTLYKLTCSRGVIIEKMHEVSKSGCKGTKLAFKPDPEVFLDAKFDYDLLRGELATMAKKYPQVQFRLVDHYLDKAQTFN